MMRSSLINNGLRKISRKSIIKKELLSLRHKLHNLSRNIENKNKKELIFREDYYSFNN